MAGDAGHLGDSRKWILQVVEAVVNGHNIEASVGEREASDVCHEELRLEGIAAGPLAGALDRPRGEVCPGDPGPEASQMLGHHARATAHLQDCLAGQVQPQKL